MNPTEDIAINIFHQMTGENVIKCFRYTISNQNYVYGIHTKNDQYVLRLALPEKKILVNSAIAIQDKLLTLNLPLSKFINQDLTGKYSPFLSLLMKCMPGNDLCHVYSQLSINDKKNLANEIFLLQEKTNGFLTTCKYGFAYLKGEEIIQDRLYSSWYDYIKYSIDFQMKEIHKTQITNIENSKDITNLLTHQENNLRQVKPYAFLRDISERNVLIHNGKISAIVDIDDIAFGDSLLVVALTEVALQEKGYDNIYTTYWKNNIIQSTGNKVQLEQRFEIYKILYCLSFIRSIGVKTSNNQMLNLNLETLKIILSDCINKLKALI